MPLYLIYEDMTKDYIYLLFFSTKPGQDQSSLVEMGFVGTCNISRVLIMISNNNFIHSTIQQHSSPNLLIDILLILILPIISFI